MLFGSPSLRSRRSRIRSRIHVFFRLTPETAGRLLPEGLRPRPWRGVVLAELRFTRCQGKSPLSRALRVRTDHLCWRLRVYGPLPISPGPATWILEHKSSSWFEAARGSTLGKAFHAHPRFRLEDTHEGIRLLVGSEASPELHLVAEPAPGSASVLLPSARALASFLESEGRVEPEAAGLSEDAPGVPEGFVPEPLGVRELEAAFFEGLPEGGHVLDCAWRWSRTQRIPSESQALEHEQSVLPAT